MGLEAVATRGLPDASSSRRLARCFLASSPAEASSTRRGPVLDLVDGLGNRRKRAHEHGRGRENPSDLHFVTLLITRVEQIAATSRERRQPTISRLQGVLVAPDADVLVAKMPEWPQMTEDQSHEPPSIQTPLDGRRSSQFSSGRSECDSAAAALRDRRKVPAVVPEDGHAGGGGAGTSAAEPATKRTDQGDIQSLERQAVRLRPRLQKPASSAVTRSGSGRRGLRPRRARSSIEAFVATATGTLSIRACSTSGFGHGFACPQRRIRSSARRGGMPTSCAASRMTPVRGVRTGFVSQEEIGVLHATLDASEPPCRSRGSTSRGGP